MSNTHLLRHFRSCLAIFLISALLAPQAVLGFNPNYLLSDTDLVDSASMSRAGIQGFLQIRGGAIANAKFDTPNNGQRSSAEILAGAASYYRMSPKVLIVILQKEQSLVTAKNPSNNQMTWATGFGVCDSCSKDDPALKKYRGFYNQVNWTAKRIRESYLADLETKGMTISGWGPGIAKTVDGQTVTPVNKATAVLYTYTPHLQGNENFVRLWNDWFFRRFPDGSLLYDPAAKEYYLIENGQKRKFSSLNVVVSSYDPAKALPTNAAELSMYTEGPAIVFSNFSLVRSPSGTIFLIVDGARRRIVSPEVFRTLGFNPEEVIAGNDADLAAYPDGVPITLASAYSAGALLQSAANGGIAYVEDGVRHAIYSKEILLSRFSGQKAVRVSQEEFDQYPLGDPIFFRDGELVTAPGNRSVYFVSNGAKRPIPSHETFERLGFKWKNVIATNERSLEILPLGEPLTLEVSETVR